MTKAATHHALHLALKLRNPYLRPRYFELARQAMLATDTRSATYYTKRCIALKRKDRLMQPAPYPPWLSLARSLIGVAEIPGPQANGLLRQWAQSLGGWFANYFADDGVPWCGLFAAHCLQSCGLSYPKTYFRARDWANYGTPLLDPILGCIVVLSRSNGGHVGFAASATESTITLIGGNQGDRVSQSPFPRNRIIALRWPDGANAARIPLDTGLRE